MALEIIGPGFGRTGTNSIKLALERLGFGPCHHMFEVRDNPARLADWETAADGRPVDWHEVFRGYRSQVDWPGARYWRELAATFPDAKVILSVRDPDSWFESVQATIHPFIEARGSHSTPHLNAIAEMAYNAIIRPTFDDRLSDRDHAIRVFERHIEEVKSTIPTERLLVFDVSEGWNPLCGFLEVDVPDEPFPRTNSSREFVDKEWAEEG
jgi:hypothetical protein